MQAEDNLTALNDMKLQLEKYTLTGVDEQGRRDIERYQKTLQNFSSTSFKKDAALGIKQLNNELKALVTSAKSNGGSIAETVIGSDEKLQSAGRALEVLYKEKVTPIVEAMKLSGTQINEKGFVTAMVNSKEWFKSLGDLTSIGEDYASSLENLDSKQQKVNATLAAYVSSNQGVIASGENVNKNLQSEIDKLKGTATAITTVSDLRRQENLDMINANITMLTGVEGREEEVKKLEKQAEQLKKVIAGTKELREELAEEKVAKKFKDDFAAGKGLSEKDKAEAEWQAGVDRLNAYVEHMEGKLATDQWYVDAKAELDQQLVESQNQAWFDMSESMSKMVGKNVAEAMTMQQTWHDTGKNIKKAILGGIVGALVAQGTQMAANAFLTKIFGAEEIAMDKAKTTESVTNTGIRTAAKAQEFAMSSAEAIANQGGGDPYSAFGRIALMTAITAGIPAIVQGLVGQVSGGREIGGHVRSGESYVVGERGAEVFTPTTAGAITSNADVKRSLGGGGGGIVNNYNDYTTNNTNIKALDSQDVRQALAKESGFLNILHKKENRRRGIS